MAVRKIVHIDEEKCDGCGLCVPSCAEGAIQIIDGKAKLVKDTYCDGLGACLGECPQDAIKIIEREADEFDEQAVDAHLKSLTPDRPPQPTPAPMPIAAHHGGCPGSAMRSLEPQRNASAPIANGSVQSQLGHWPIQLMLVPPGAPFLSGADILVCADCVPFAVPDFHSKYLAGKAVLVACPKLDDLEFYREKLRAIFATAKPNSLTVLKMEVPCCNGIAMAALEARDYAAPEVPVRVETIGIRGGTECQDIPAKSKVV